MKLMKEWQRTPISYYGGKQTMLKYILPLIPEHKIYVEPFFGGGAVFWAKNPAKIEVINDFNSNIYNFYNVLKNNFSALRNLVQKTIHSREVYKSALVIYHSPSVFSEVHRAWAFWYATNGGYSNIIGNYRYDNKGKAEQNIKNKRIQFTDIYSNRLEKVQIESHDACNVIKTRDTDNSFFYCDPPYVGANQGHYGGYTQEIFDELLSALASVKGKFLLSSYPNEAFAKYITRYGWHQKEIIIPLGTSNVKGRKRKEILTANYPI